MALTLTNILQSVYQTLGELNMSKATGGSTTTVVDSILANTSRDNVWKEGTLFVVRDAGGASAAPEGQYNRISAYANATGTFTVDTAFTTATGAGDLYGVASNYYPLQQVIRAVNEALSDLGDVDLVDTTTLDAAAATTEYAASATWKRTRPARIDIQTLTTSTSDNQWQEVGGWDWIPAAAGSAGKIIFYDYPTASRDIRVWYRSAHPAVALYTDVIHEVFDPELVRRAAVVKALEWQNARTQGADEFITVKLSAASQQLENRRVTNPTYRPKRGPRLMIVSSIAGQYDDIDTP